MKTKFVNLLFVSLSSVVCFSSCSKANSDPDTIKIAVVGDQSERDVLKAFIAGYKALPGNEDKKISPIYMEDYDGFIERTLRNKKGVLPDIIQVFDIKSGYYANADLDGAGNSLLIPISSYMKRDGIGESSLVDASVSITKCRIGSDEMYWVPRDYNKIVVAYNKEMFRLAGITERPSDDWTWGDFVEICETLKAHENEIMEYSRKDVFYPVDMNLNFQAVYYPFLESYGIPLVDAKTKTCFGDDLEGAKNAWGKLLNMVIDGLAAPADNKIPFASKQSAMMFITRPDLPNYVNGVGNNNIDFITLPTNEGLTDGQISYIGMGATGYGITTHCPDSKKEAAWDFLKYIISVDGQNVFSKTGSCIPCLKSLLSDENAEFRQYINKDLNHEAFVSYTERDLFAGKFLEGLDPEEQRDVYNVIHDNALHNFFYDGEIDEGFFAEFKDLVEAEME